MDKKLNLLLFSGNYDKALAALILANSARSMNIDVSMFFAFWGLLLLRKPGSNLPDNVDKNILEKIFSLSTPEGAEELPLSRMNLSGLGKKMLQEMMENTGTPDLSDFLGEAREQGVRFYGCKLSMEVMGFEPQELIGEVEVIEAGDYLRDALEADLQLFI